MCSVLMKKYTWIPVALLTIFIFLLLLSLSTPMPPKKRASISTSMSNHTKDRTVSQKECMCEEGCPCKELHGDHGPCTCVAAKEKALSHCICDTSCPCKVMKCGIDASQCPCRMMSKLKNKTSSRSQEDDRLDVLLEQRAHGLLNAWKDTLQNRLLNTTDLNVMYDMWYSNMARRGLAPLYASEDVFHLSMPPAMNGTLTLLQAKMLLQPYVAQEKLTCKPIAMGKVCLN